jgi:hypothetical protein
MKDFFYVIKKTTKKMILLMLRLMRNAYGFFAILINDTMHCYVQKIPVAF